MTNASIHPIVIYPPVVTPYRLANAMLYCLWYSGMVPKLQDSYN
ncbi:MAG: hypothetical protein QNL65_09505 [Opitutales bacterium]